MWPRVWKTMPHCSDKLRMPMRQRRWRRAPKRFARNTHGTIQSSKTPPYPLLAKSRHSDR
jgi:hypothetical protein